MKKVETMEYTLPTFWAGLLFNDDATYLTDEEEEEIKEFLFKQLPFVPSEIKNDNDFCYSNDFKNEGCECSTYIFIKR